MSDLSLGQLFRKRKRFSGIVSRLAASIAAHVMILDADGTKLLASSDDLHDENRFPVQLEDNIIGWVCGNPDQAELLAQLLAYNAELELERKKLGEETLHKYKELSMLYNMADQIPSCLEAEQVLRLLSDQLRLLLGFDTINILLSKPDEDELTVVISEGSTFAEGSSLVPEGVMHDVWHSGRAEIINDVTTDYRFVARQYPVSSLICTPLKSKEKILGLVEITSIRPTTFTAENLRLLTTLAAQAAAQIENTALLQQLKDAFYITVYTLAETIEKRDPYTGNHTKRVMEYSLALGRTLGLSEHQLRRLELAAVLHDVGKIGIPDTVLLKKEPLNDDEFRQIKMHTIYGEEILSRIPQLKDIMPGVKQHHERFDGRGYPDGLKGEEIDITARIIAVADTFDAMTTDRPYRKGFPFEEAFEELQRNSGTQFDPSIIAAFLETDIMEAYFTARTKPK